MRRVRIASVEVIPYALPFREPYVTARGRLDRREMVLLRLRAEDGLVGLGEAVPLSLRGGAALAQVVDELEALRRARPSSTRRRCGGDAAALSAPARCAALTALLDLRGTASRGDGEPAGAERRAGRVQRDAGRGRAGGGRRRRRCAGRRRASRPSSSSSAPATTSARCERCARRSGPRRGSGSTPTRPGTSTTAKRTLAELEPLEIELAEQPVATLEEAAEVAARDLDPARRRRERREPRRRRAGGRDSAPATLTGVKLSKVGGPEAAIEIAEVLPSYVSSALDGPVGIAAAAPGRRRRCARPHRPASAASPTASPPSASSPRRSPRSSASCATGMLHLPAGPGLGVEIDEDALDAHRL